MKFIFTLIATCLITAFSYAGIHPTLKNAQQQNDEPLPYMLVPYRVKNLWGFSDVKGNIKIAPEYDDFKQIKYYWSDGASFQSIMIVSKNGSSFAINQHNQIIVPASYHFDQLSADEYYYGLVTVIKQDKKGVFYNRKQIIPCQYQYIEREKNLSFRVSNGGNSGIINSSGKIVVPVAYYGIGIDSANKQSITWGAVKEKDKRDFFKDKLVVDPGKQESRSYSIQIMSPAYLDLSKDARDTIMKNMRKTYSKAIMDKRYCYIIYVNQNNKWGIFNILQNKQTVPCQYDDLIAEKDTKPKIAILARKGALYGYIDEDNNVLAPVVFNSITHLFVNFLLRQGQKVGLLTSVLEYIPPRYLSIKYYDEAFDLKNNKLQTIYEVTTLTGKKGYINSAGFEYFKD